MTSTPGGRLCERDCRPLLQDHARRDAAVVVVALRMPHDRWLRVGAGGAAPGAQRDGRQARDRSS